MARKTRKRRKPRTWNRVYSRSYEAHRSDRRRRVDRVELIFTGKMSRGLRVLRTEEDRVIIGIGNASINYAGAVNELRPWFGISDADRKLFREDAHQELLRLMRKNYFDFKQSRGKKKLLKRRDLKALGILIVGIIKARAFQKGNGLNDEPHKTYRQLEAAGKVGR